MTLSPSPSLPFCPFASLSFPSCGPSFLPGLSFFPLSLSSLFLPLSVFLYSSLSLPSFFCLFLCPFLPSSLSLCLLSLVSFFLCPSVYFSCSLVPPFHILSPSKARLTAVSSRVGTIINKWSDYLKALLTINMMNELHQQVITLKKS